MENETIQITAVLTAIATLAKLHWPAIRAAAAMLPWLAEKKATSIDKLLAFESIRDCLKPETATEVWSQLEPGKETEVAK